jgi:phosphocarrier protein HPr
MAERLVAVANTDGLHARPAALFVKAVSEAGIAVTIGKAGADTGADARSILAVLALDVRHGDQVVLRADGDGADDALDRLAALLADANV